MRKKNDELKVYNWSTRSKLAQNCHKVQEINIYIKEYQQSERL